MSEIYAIAVRLVMAVLGTIGFAMMYRVSRKRMPYAALGGFLTYAVYELVIQLGGAVFIAALISAAFMTLYSETLARIIQGSTIMRQSKLRIYRFSPTQRHCRIWN